MDSKKSKITDSERLKAAERRAVISTAPVMENDFEFMDVNIDNPGDDEEAPVQLSQTHERSGYYSKFWRSVTTHFNAVFYSCLLYTSRCV